MAQNVSEFIVDRLQSWGVRRIFGYPGDGVAGMDVAVDDADKAGRLKFVQVRHEEMAAFMASAHAKFTGEVGVCMATSGPGAVHLLNGLYDARLDHQPVVAIVGQHGTPVIGGSDQQELDLKTLFKDVAGAFCEMASTPEQVRHLIDRAFRIAIAEKRVTCVILPANIQTQPAVVQPPHKHGYEHSSVGYSTPRVVPYEADLQRAADVLNEGKKVSILIGAGAKGATDELIQVAELLGCGIAKALLGKQVVPDDLPFVTGSIGLLGTAPSSDMMDGCDTLLMVGTGFPWTEFLPKEGQARAVQIDIDPEMLGLRYPVEVNLHGDSRLTLQALIPLLRRKEDRAWRQTIEKHVSKWWETLEARAMHAAEPLNPQRVFWELSKQLPERTIVTADSGSVANWYARDLKFRRGMMGSLSGGLASLGAGTPYAVAAKFAFPDRPVIACMGDGAMQMNGINELITVSKYWKEWETPHWICLVLNNRDLNQVTWEERAQSGEPKTMSTQSIPSMPYHKYAELIGLKGIYVDNPDQVAAAWREALASDRPVVLEAFTDPNVPPLPPHITVDQAKQFAKSLPRDPERGSIIRNAAREMLSSILPGRH
ncbi:thiamine pyrophosphate-requiring protein [Rhizosaccharibacter radicis]|uniref:Thiamine pyrophosphate-requiring protein n=1 Tax=Rhizosaccharibacter radicis TaxID=2782605 RepID=A0ABT1VUA8_9PROT|nr:thiamine pyrophosphate-requiring protein [Acetobacteraceae bacterium KSS12]